VPVWLQPPTGRLDDNGRVESEKFFLASVRPRNLRSSKERKDSQGAAPTTKTNQRTEPVAKFMFLYRDPVQPVERPSPEEMQAILAQWGAWFQKFGASIVDGGDGLKPGGKILKADGIVTDGPYVEAKEVIGGYTVVQADDYEGALVIARECPIMKSARLIEIREFAGYN
jgi:hypothetical protein